MKGKFKPQNAAKDDLFDELRKSDIRLKNARTNLIRFNIRVQKAQLVTLADAEQAWRLSISAAREKILALPPTMAHTLVAVSGRSDLLSEYEILLKKALFEAMEEISQQVIEVESALSNDEAPDA